MLLTADAAVTTDLTGTEIVDVDAALTTIAACGSFSFLYAVAASETTDVVTITDVDAETTVVSGSSCYSSSVAVLATTDVDANQVMKERDGNPIPPLSFYYHPLCHALSFPAYPDYLNVS